MQVILEDDLVDSCKSGKNELLLTYMQSTSWEATGQDEAQAGIKIARRNINNLRYAHDTTLMAESERN